MSQKMAVTKAIAVANLMLDFAEQEGVSIRHLKLQKLVYFCYAWYAGRHQVELFSENIEAWKYGPVIRDVYLKFKDSGDQPITKRALEFDRDEQRRLAPTVCGETALELKEIWDGFKDKSDGWLVAATHARGEPWEIFMRDEGNAQRPIPFELIRNVYIKNVEWLNAKKAEVAARGG